MIQVKRRKPSNQFFIPHFGNIINEVMNSSLEEIVNQKPKNATTPSVNVHKNEDAFTLVMALPGYDKKEVEIKIEKDLLTISSERENQSEEKFRLKEFNFGSFERKFHLPKNVDQENIEAAFKNGLLTIKLSIKPESKPKSIAIN